MKKYSAAVAKLIIITAVAGCGGGGGNSGGPTPAPPVGSPAISVSPASYDFGKVTAGNSPAPLEVTIQNNGTAALQVSAISLAQPSDPSFSLSLNGGSKPCNSASPILAVGGSCTFRVAFQPAVTGSFAANVRITSNDVNVPISGLSVSGTSEPVATLFVQINQVETACPSNEVTAYISVTDQGGYPVPGLQSHHFSVSEGNTNLTITSFSSIDVVYKPIAAAAAMDYSDSLTDQPIAFADMKSGFTSFFSGLRASDIGEILKFDDEVEVVQPFTADKAALLAAISAPFDKGANTRLNDAVFQAVNDTALNVSYRRAVIVATDGIDAGPVPGVQYSNRSLTEVINNAVTKKVPIFTVGLGASIDRAVLQEMAGKTGGLFYEANTSQNLANVYQQLSSILYENQYALTFTQLTRGAAGVSSGLTIGANFNGITGNPAVTTITSCN